MELATSSAEITRLLQAWGGGDTAALESLTPLVYAELRRMARRSMRHENPGHTLQPTALVHEAYLRLVDIAQDQWQDRAHFFAVAAQTMRRILVDGARARMAGKRGGEAVHVNLNESIDAMPDHGSQLVALDDALEALAQLDSRKAKVIEMRFFGGLSVEETAEVLKISPETVMRDWKMARAWLMRELAAPRRP
uniref:RNA polymerase, sigma-24 subunit, ECF subfamily n=1 Tax=Solibacter usitatus (strain Ellin6076) TaxID=234267 RepID=Q01P44_SOLUE